MVKESLRSYLPEKIGGWKAVGEPEFYDRETIFKYIDGAGEVYRQYDFRQLLVRKYTDESGLIITTELFDMGSPQDAYGIFSHSRDEVDAGIGQGSEFKGGLLSFWKGKYFACVYSDDQSAQSDDCVTDLAGEIDSLIPEEGDVPEIISYLPNEGLAESRIRFFHRNTSLNLHYFLSEENLLNLDDSTDVVFAEYVPDGTRILLVCYPDTEAAGYAENRFKASYIPDADSSGSELIEGGKWVTARSVNRFVIIVLDSPVAIRALELAERTTRNILASISGRGDAHD